MNSLLRVYLSATLVAVAVILIGIGLARHDADLTAPLHLLLFVIGTAVYLLPTALALYRNSTSTAWIAVLDILLGWTVFGWFVALGWAAGGKTLPIHPAPRSHPLAGH